MGYKKIQESGGPKNTKLALSKYRKKGYQVKVVKGNESYGTYIKREIWVKKRGKINKFLHMKR